jgi:branched-subunit amino acid aminotransferase/4-amino-4-deoxychorismate lyase
LYADAHEERQGLIKTVELNCRMFINHNGTLLPQAVPIATADNLSLRYGDGCFETMRYTAGTIPLWTYHWERLLHSLDVLAIKQLPHFNEEYLLQQIAATVQANQQPGDLRIRLNVYRENAQTHAPDFIIETAIIEAYTTEGLKIAVYPHAVKSCDRFSSIKSNNHLSYLMAGRWAKAQQLDDAIVLNCYGRVADTSIANIFTLRDGIVRTPSLKEGCINGVQRRHQIATLRSNGMIVEECSLTVNDLSEAEELLLTNAVRGVMKAKLVG